MSVNFIVYGIGVYFAALLVAAASAFWGNDSKKSSLIFSAANAFGFLLGLSYIFRFSGQEIVLVEWNMLFHFKPVFNNLSAIFFTLTSGVSSIVGVYGIRYLKLYCDSYHPEGTKFLIVFFVLGMQGVLFANNPFVFLLFWEVMSIASFFLVMIDGASESVRAAFLYFIMTHLGASAILGGFLLLGHGSLFFDFSGIAEATGNLPAFPTVLALGLFIFGFGSKAGLAPFHVWLPEAHPQAPSNVSALMSGLMLKVAVFGFIKIVLSFAGFPIWAGATIMVLGLGSAVWGALSAAAERDMKRVFAFSSIENMGLIFTMLGMAIHLVSRSSEEGMAIASGAIVAFALFHAINHALFKTALFLASGVVISRVHSKSLEMMGGLARIMPFFSFVFLVVVFASLPLPPFGVFFGEVGFIQTIIQLFRNPAADSVTLAMLVAVLGLVGLVGGLAVFAMVKVFGISMLGLSRAKHLENRSEREDYMLILPIATLGLGALVIGIFSRNIIAWLMSGGIGFPTSVSDSNGSVSLPSAMIFLILLFFVAIAYLFRRACANNPAERRYHTWDCGQPINCTMEYTATAFSGPIRFFFLHLLGRDKTLVSTPVVCANPWIRNYTFSLSFKSVWKEKIYNPAAKMLKFVAQRIKLIQSGRIQYYLLFLLATLIITLIISL